MVHNKVTKAFERNGNSPEEREKQGKKDDRKAKIRKPRHGKAKGTPKPITAKTLAYQARTAHNKRRKELHHIITCKADRDGLSVENAHQLLRYMSKKSFKGKPRLRDLDEHALAYVAKVLERDMGAGYRRELTPLEALETDEGEERAFQEQEIMGLEEGLQRLGIKEEVEGKGDQQEESIEGLWERLVVIHLTGEE